MWGAGQCVGPISGFWWIFPVIGLLICLFFVVAVVRMMSRGGRFMCMGPHHHESNETARSVRDTSSPPAASPTPRGDSLG
jgi:uncharacterized membrane protein